MSTERRQDLLYPPGPHLDEGRDEEDRRPPEPVLAPSQRLHFQLQPIRHNEAALEAALRRLSPLDRLSARTVLSQLFGGHYFGGIKRAVALCERVWGPGSVDYPIEREWKEDQKRRAERRPMPPVATLAEAQAAYLKGRVEVLRERLAAMARDEAVPSRPEFLTLLWGMEDGVARAALAGLAGMPVSAERPGRRDLYDALSAHFEAEATYFATTPVGRKRLAPLPGAELLRPETRVLGQVGGRAGGLLLGSWDEAASQEERAQRETLCQQVLSEAPAALGILSQGGGEPLPEALRVRMERLLGHDFAAVRIHTDGAAAEAARLLGARALALGRHIYFGPGQYAPGTMAGDRLLVHELVHVVQFDEGWLPEVRGVGLQVSQPEDGAEREAEARARGINPAGSGVLVSRPLEGLARQADQVAAQVGPAASQTEGASMSVRAEASHVEELEPVAPPVPVVHRDADDEADGEITSTTALLLNYAQRQGGQPLPPELRVSLEAALGVDLGAVRLHDDPAAADAARALNARAFTLGQDIYFRAGAFEPDSDGGRRLIAHEVAHTQQPDGTLTATLQVSAPGDAAEREAEHFADRFAGRSAERFADTFAGALHDADDQRRSKREREELPGVLPMPLTAARAPGVVHLDRTPGPRERATRMTIALGGRVGAIFTVESDGGAPFTATGTATGLTPGTYTVHTPRGATQMHIAAADTSGPQRTLEFHISIPPSERGMHTLLRRAHTPIPMMVTGGADPAATGIGDTVPRTGGPLDQLPERVRRILFSSTGTRAVNPADEPALLRIGNKLAQLSPSELEAFLARTIGVTSYLTVYEASVDRYLAEVRQQQAADAEVDRTRTRLFGLDQLYDRYRQYRQMLTTSPVLAGGRFNGSGLGVSIGMIPTLNQMRQELTARLARHGFASIDAFEAAIYEYLNAVRTTAVLIGREQLDRYEHRLAEEQARYQDSASATTLHSSLGTARDHFQRANQIRDRHASVVVLDPGEQMAAAAEFNHE